MSMKASAITIMAMFAFASGAFANTETERQCFAPETNACAVESANDGVFLLADCIEPGEYGDCVRGCESIYDACMVTAANDKDAKNCASSLENCITSNVTGCRKKC